MLRQVIIIFLITVVTSKAVSQNLDIVQSELEQIYSTSLKLRISANKFLSTGNVDSRILDSLKTVIIEFDSLSLQKVEVFLSEHGWLGISAVGEQANQAIYLTIQHAELGKQIKYFPMLKESALEGESHLADMATMEDRILVREGKMQKYGTQSRYVDGQKELLPIEDPKNVNKWRKSVGLKRIKKNKRQ